jgi:hypothetical protein
MVSQYQSMTSVEQDFLDPRHDVSLSAYLRLQKLEGSASTSALNIRKYLQQSLSPSSHFIPFLHERDQLGHLLTPSTSSIQSIASPLPSQQPLPRSTQRFQPPRGRPLKVSTLLRRCKFPP